MTPLSIKRNVRIILKFKIAMRVALSNPMSYLLISSLPEETMATKVEQAGQLKGLQQKGGGN